MNTESNSDQGSDATSTEEEDDEPKKKGRRPREKKDDVKGFTQSEVRKFVRSFRKFGDPLNRLVYFISGNSYQKYLSLLKTVERYCSQPIPYLILCNVPEFDETTHLLI